jgi:hypothetical protein
VACEVLPRRTHGICTTHFDHLAFVTSPIDTSTIYRDRSDNNKRTAIESTLGGRPISPACAIPSGAAAQCPVWCRRRDRDARLCRCRNGRRSCFQDRSSGMWGLRDCWFCQALRGIRGTRGPRRSMTRDHQRIPSRHPELATAATQSTARRSPRAARAHTTNTSTNK